jgi:ribose transport system substrate-binding protein
MTGLLYRRVLLASVAAAFCAASSAAFGAGLKVVSGPAADQKCFVPWSDKTKFFQGDKKPGPYRIALANGFIANTWRIQMIKTAKAYAEQPEVKAKLKEFKVVSTGEDVAAQIAAINNFIDSGYDAIVVNAQNPKAFAPVIRRAKQAGVVLVAFDNILDTEDAINVNVDQKGLGILWANWLIKHIPSGGKVLEIRGVAGTSVDTDRHDGIHETLKKSGKTWNVVEVVGKWDDPTAQKATADAIAVHKKFDGITAQGGDTGAVQAMLDAKHPFVPFEVLRQVREPGPEVLLGRHRPGPGRRRHQDRHRRTGGAGGAAVDQAADVDRGSAGLQGRRQLLLRAVGQLLRRQRLPDLRHQLHRPADHGPEREEQLRKTGVGRWGMGSGGPGETGSVPHSRSPHSPFPS